MSNDYYLVHVETFYQLRRGLFVPKAEDELERPRCIHKVSGAKAAEVAAVVCDKLDVTGSGRDYRPRFVVVPASELKPRQAAGFDKRVRALDGASGSTDSENPDNRDAAYHIEALALEAAVREQLGLVTVKQPEHPESNEAEGPISDRPDDHGFVALPADTTAYLPAADILSDHTPPEICTTHKQLRAILDKHPEIKRWRPRSNRLSVHLADWRMFVKEQEANSGKGDPDESAIADRKATIRRATSGG